MRCFCFYKLKENMEEEIKYFQNQAGIEVLNLDGSGVAEDNINLINQKILRR